MILLWFGFGKSNDVSGCGLVVKEYISVINATAGRDSELRDEYNFYVPICPDSYRAYYLTSLAQFILSKAKDTLQRSYRLWSKAQNILLVSISLYAKRILPHRNIDT